MIRFSENARARALLFAIFASVICASTHAEADAPSPAFSAENLATAREALRDGLALRDAGNLPSALAKLHLAHTLIAIPVTGYELGKTHMMMGQLLSARELFLEVGRLPRSIEESERSETARRESEKLAAELEPHIPALRFKLTLAKGASAVVKVDGVVVSQEALDAPRRVNPGSHEVVAKAGEGPDQRVDVVVKDGETKDVELAPKWIPPKEPPPPERPFYVKTTTNRLLYFGVGVIAASVVGETVGIITHLQAESSLHDECFAAYCVPGAAGDFQKANAGDVLIVGSLIGAGVGLTLLIFGVSNPHQERVYTSFEPVIGPTSLGLRGTF